MATDLETIIGYKNLCGVIQGVKGGTGMDFPPEFLRVTKQISGKTGEYTRVDGDRKVARIVAYGSPSQRRNLTGISKVAVNLLHSFEHEIIEGAILLALQDSNAQKQEMGAAEIARQTGDFARRFDELRKAMVRSILATGQIHFDEDGNLLASSDGAAFSIDFGVPAGNKDQLDVFGDGDIIDVSWDNAAAKIAVHMRALQEAAVRLTGYELTHAFYGKNIVEYLLKNTSVGKLIQNNNALNTSLQSGIIPDGFMGIQKWFKMNVSFFEDEDGEIVEIFGDNDITFTPTPSSDWWGFIEGSYPVPTNLGNVSGDASGAAGGLAEIFGRFSYAHIINDPTGIKQYAGDTMLPVLQVPKAIFIATVDFE